MLAFVHGDVDDLAGDIRRDQHLLRADISIVGRDVAAAHQIERQLRPARCAGSTTSRIMRSRLRPARAPAASLRRSAGSGRCLGFLRGDELQGQCQPWRAFFLLRLGTWLALRIAARRLSFIDGEFAQQAFVVFAVEPGERAPHQVVAELGEVLQQRPRGQGEVEPLGAPVLGSARRSIRPLSQSRSSSRVSVIGCRSSISASSDCLRPGAVEPGQHGPLRPGHAELAPLWSAEVRSSRATSHD